MLEAVLRRHALEKIDTQAFKLNKIPIRNQYSSAMLAKLSNLVNGLMKASFTVPVGPLRCLPMMISATPGSRLSLL